MKINEQKAVKLISERKKLLSRYGYLAKIKLVDVQLKIIEGNNRSEDKNVKFLWKSTESQENSKRSFTQVVQWILKENF